MPPHGHLIGRAVSYYAAAIADFRAEASDTILGALTRRSGFAVEPAQNEAWQAETAVLKTALTTINGTIYLEFDVPRIGSRIDVVVVSGPAVFVIEFKVGEETFHTLDINQAWDYALDLKNVHRSALSAADSKSTGVRQAFQPGLRLSRRRSQAGPLLSRRICLTASPRPDMCCAVLATGPL